MQKEAKFAKWIYYLNDEGKARWKCSECGKVVKHNPHEDYYCKNCGCKMSMQS